MVGFGSILKVELLDLLVDLLVGGEREGSVRDNFRVWF